MPQPKKPAVKAAKLSPARVRKVADSLMDVSGKKKSAAYTNQLISDSQKKYVGRPIDSLMKSPGWGKMYKENRRDVLISVQNGKLATPIGQPSADERSKMAQAQRKSASVDSANAVRYRKLADKSTKKK